jgi:predicted PurR-regulated permease PerM
MGEPQETAADGAREDGRTARPGPASDASFPPWSSAFLRRAALWLMAAIAGGLLLGGIAESLAHRLAGFFEMIVISLFLAAALEPAVGYLARRGWRRGLATGLVFAAAGLAIAGLLALLVPALVAGTRQLLGALPDLVANLARYLRPLGIRLDNVRVEDQLREHSSQLLNMADGVFQVATAFLGGVFQTAAIALFTFYMVARGPQMRRAVLSRFRPDRQQRILYVWEQAIGQTGGYFYSRLLLAVVNGALMYAVLAWRDVPFAAPLAVFEGTVATFIPIVGTYIAGAVPVLTAVLHDPLDGVIVLAWIVLYQQVENYFLAPRLTARTMALSAPVTFAAALVGGILGGIVFAFLALPVAGVIQSAIRAYGRSYEVIDHEMTALPSSAGQSSSRSGSSWPPWPHRQKRNPPAS